MIRESDEECFLLIATVRDTNAKGRCIRYADIERLLGNLEARIQENHVLRVSKTTAMEILSMSDKQ